MKNYMVTNIDGNYSKYNSENETFIISNNKELFGD